VRIPPGAKFIDPSVTTTTAAGDDEATDTTGGDGATAAPAGDRCNPIYVVESGDAPLVITRKFDITIEQLNAVNEGVTPDWPNLYTGREVRLPPPADCP
jgi:LysM repeat protein